MKLNVPIAAEGLVADYQQHARIYHNGSKTIAPSVKPSIYTKFDPEALDDDLKNLFFNYKSEPVQRISADTKRLEQWYQIEFDSEISLKYLKKQIREASKSTDPHSEAVMELFGNNKMQVAGVDTKYVDYVLTKDEAYFRQFTCDDVVVLGFDVEQWSEGKGFTQTMRNPLMSIAVSVMKNGQRTMHYFAAEKPEDGQVPRDRELLVDFVKLFKEVDPDIIVGFNCSGYDIPVINSRLEKHGIKSTFWDRNGQREPWIQSKVKIGVNKLDIVHIDGRVVYDVQHAVMADQTLNGQVKNRKLKTVSKYYQSKGVIPSEVLIVEEEMSDNRVLCGTEKLQLYNESDVRITDYLFDMYVQNNIAVAEFIGCPLQQVVPMATSYPFTVLCAQLYDQLGIVANGKNIDRNFKYFDTGGKPFQGADVGCFKTGRFSPAFETDVGSLYPSLIASLGLGPENTRILRTEPFTGKSPPFKATKDGECRIYYVPDEIRQWVWVIEVNGYSKIAEKVREFLKTRLELKHFSGLLKDYSVAMKEKDMGRLMTCEAKLVELGRSDLIDNMDACASEQYNAYVRAYGLKVVLNSVYGLMGARYNLYGELAAATLITGAGRQILAQGVKFLGEETCILMDTDGIKTSNDCNINAMNDATDAYVENELHGLPMIKWEKEAFQVIYSKAMKTYLLIDEDGKLVIHGVGFKSSAAPPVFDRIIKVLGRAMLEQGHEKTRGMAMRYFNMSALEKADYVLTRRMQKPVEEYDDGNMVKKIALMYKEMFNTEPTAGTVYEFVKTRRGYEPPTDEAMTRLDMKYYKRVVEKAVNALGYDNIFNRTLQEFF